MKGKTNISDRHPPEGILKDENPIGKILDKMLGSSRKNQKKNVKTAKKKGK